mmetsp:Transcript_21629/g.36206  ORF Transcript_21629/g.36206 Transcript_21629/m.36206 type:complete len:226 (-) Transcript_21629:1422-2099(-)
MIPLSTISHLPWPTASETVQPSSSPHPVLLHHLHRLLLHLPQLPDPSTFLNRNPSRAHLGLCMTLTLRETPTRLLSTSRSLQEKKKKRKLILILIIPIIIFTTLVEITTTRSKSTLLLHHLPASPFPSPRRPQQEIKRTTRPKKRKRKRRKRKRAKENAKRLIHSRSKRRHTKQTKKTIQDHLGQMIHQTSSPSSRHNSIRAKANILRSSQSSPAFSTMEKPLLI